MPIVSTQFVNSTERVGVVTGGVPADAALQPAIASITAHPNDINNGAIVLLPLFITEVPSFPANPLHLTGNQLEFEWLTPPPRAWEKYRRGVYGTLMPSSKRKIQCLFSEA